MYILLTSGEFYSDSYIVGLTTTAWATEVVRNLAKASYGSIHAIYGADVSQATDSNLVTSAWDGMAFVGNLKGKGILGFGTVSGPTLTVSTSVLTDTTYCSASVCSYSAPTGGVAQFKGLTLGSTELRFR